MLRQFPTLRARDPAVPAALFIVAADGVAPSRWRNGAGWTRELLAWPSPGDWTVRVSVADIEADGPFSAFPGVDRWFAVLDGDGVELVHGGAPPVALSASDPIHRFAGEAATTCRLRGGPTRDFNLMVRRERAQAHVAPLTSAARPGGDWSGCFAATPARIRPGGDGPWQALPAMSLAWTRAAAGIDVEPSAGTRGWRIDVRHVEGAA